MRSAAQGCSATHFCPEFWTQSAVKKNSPKTTLGLPQGLFRPRPAAGKPLDSFRRPQTPLLLAPRRSKKAAGKLELARDRVISCFFDGLKLGLNERMCLRDWSQNRSGLSILGYCKKSLFLPEKNSIMTPSTSPFNICATLSPATSCSGDANPPLCITTTKINARKSIPF